MNRLQTILRYLRGFRLKIAQYFIFNFLGIVFGLLSFNMLIPVIEILFGTKQPQKVNVAQMQWGLEKANAMFREAVMAQDRLHALGSICVIVVGFTVFKNLFLYLSLYTLNPIRNEVLSRLRLDMFGKILTLPIGYFSEERKGDLISRMTNDINEVELSIMSVLEVFIREPLTIIAYLTAMIYMNSGLTLILFLFLPLAGFVIGRIAKALRKESANAMQQLSGIMSIVEETLTGIRVLKSFNAEGQQMKRFEGAVMALFRSRNRIAARRELASPVSETMGVIVVSVILWIGGQMVFANTGFTGASFIAYIAMFTQIISPFKNLSAAFSNVQKGASALERMEQILEVENKITDCENPKSIEKVEHAIVLNNVCFSYNDKQVLKNINITIEKGKITALVGASGAGKSTLADLIPRFHDPTSGTITIDGINLKDYRIADLWATVPLRLPK
ncbi:MAG: ABC transporter ATP-binding protein [Chitinophagia bacterium]|nr:ABC transporter ATP-binding protein [Chitinophagia bacterium]